MTSLPARAVLVRSCITALVLASGLILGACAGTVGTAVAVPGTVTVTAPAITVTVTAPAAASVDESALETTDDQSAADDSSIPGLDSEGTDVDPCKLVTLADAETLAATKLDKAVAIKQTCTYTGPVTGPTAQVQVFVGPGAKKQLDIEHTLSHAVRKITGAGDEAWAGDWAVYVRKGQLWVSVNLVRLNDAAENVTRLEHVAKVVGGRM